MERIISDYYIKGEKRLFDDESASEFNVKLLAVNDMYGWMYNKGILRESAFEFKDYDDIAYFALDVKELELFRAEMEQSGVVNADIAVKYIFDEEITPCLYSGAIQLGWPMMTYRDVDGIVGRSWECELIKFLNTSAAREVKQIKTEKGVRDAVKAAYNIYDFEPDLFEQACEYYKDWVNVDNIDGDRDFLNEHAEKLIYCFKNKKDLIDFDFWVQYEVLLGEKITYDEYLAIDSKYDGDPHDIEPSDLATIIGFEESLADFRSSESVRESIWNNHWSNAKCATSPTVLLNLLKNHIRLYNGEISSSGFSYPPDHSENRIKIIGYIKDRLKGEFGIDVYVRKESLDNVILSSSKKAVTLNSSSCNKEKDNDRKLSKNEYDM